MANVQNGNKIMWQWLLEIPVGTIFCIAKISLVWAAICAPNNTSTAILDAFYKDFTVQWVRLLKYGRHASLILFRANHVNKDLSYYGWIEPKPLPYFFKRRKQCEDKSDKESKTMQVTNEDVNDVDDPTKEIAAKAQRKFQLRWLKSYPWLDYDQENNSMKCSLCD